MHEVFPLRICVADFRRDRFHVFWEAGRDSIDEVCLELGEF